MNHICVFKVNAQTTLPLENLAVSSRFVYHLEGCPVKTTLLTVPLLAFAVFFLIQAEIRKRRWQTYIFKPMATLVVIFMALASLLEPIQNSIYTLGILVGLLFSLGGDVVLMFQEKRRAFVGGLIFFVLAHIAYSVVFSLLGRVSAWDIITTILLILAGWGFYRLIRPRLGSMKYPVIIYIVIISFMVSRALTAFKSPAFRTGQALMIASGAILFYFSDVILAANKFWRPWKYHRVNLVFYYCGQCLIALAASHFV